MNLSEEASPLETADAPSARQAREDSYDAVVIGAGIGGLTAGALIARAGRKVLVVEAEAQPGGHTRSLRDGPHTFDRADHLIMGCEPASAFGPGIVQAVLAHLSVLDRCEFIRVDTPIYRACFPGLSVDVPHGREAYLEAHLRHFPGEADGLRNLVELSARIYREWREFPMKPTVRDLLMVWRRFPTLFRYRNATLGEVIDRELHDPRLKAVYAALCSWLGLSPERLSFVDWGVLMAGYVEEGAFYCRGSFQSLADAFAAGLQLAGGELLLGTRATRILAEGGRVRGVELESGQRVRAPLVVSNVDTRETFERMLGADRVPARLMRRMQRLRLSADIPTLYLATDLDPTTVGAQYDQMVYAGWDPDQVLSRDPVAGRVNAIDVMIPTLADPSLAPPGEHVVIAQTLLPPDASDSLRDDHDLAERMLELSEYVLPGLRGSITKVGSVGAGAERFPINRIETMYGWELSPGQTGMRRPPQETPVAGLFLAGQWTRPGGGVITVIASGIQAARLALGEPTHRPPLPLA